MRLPKTYRTILLLLAVPKAEDQSLIQKTMSFKNKARAPYTGTNLKDTSLRTSFQ